MIDGFLKKSGYEDRVSSVFSQLALYKDKPDELRSSLPALDPETLKGLDYLRRLIGLADCFDIIRCAGEFQYSCIRAKLSDIQDFDDHSVFWEFAQRVYELLKRQHDLFFETRLIGPGEEVYQLVLAGDDFSIRHKVQFEHASNVLQAIENDMMELPYNRVCRIASTLSGRIGW